MAISLSLSHRRMINEALKLKLVLEAFSANQTEVIKIQFLCHSIFHQSFAPVRRNFLFCSTKLKQSCHESRRPTAMVIGLNHNQIENLQNKSIFGSSQNFFILF